MKFLIIKHAQSKVFAIFLALSLVFLQEGLSYYFSFQCFAVFLISYLVVYCHLTLKDLEGVFFVLLVFTTFTCTTTIIAPHVISRNTSNLFLTLSAIVLYAFIIAIFISLKIKNINFFLRTIRLASALTICILSLMLIIEYFNLFSALSRESFFLQNSRLITNYSAADVLQNELTARARRDLLPRVDLFYGEVSYLAIVLFTCLGSFAITEKVIAHSLSIHSSISKIQPYSFLRYSIILLIGIMSLLYIRSLSSIIYAGLIFLFYFIEYIFDKLKLLGSFIFALLLLLIVFYFTDVFEYVAHRLSMNMQESLSLNQRFGSLSDFGINEYIFGLKNESMIPREGFHNGLIYIIAISGLGGGIYLTFLLARLYFLANKVSNMPSFFVLLLLAQFVQNGAAFSPNKIVLYSMILLPLCCVRTNFITRKMDRYSPSVKVN